MLLAFLSASQDVVIDAYRADVLTDKAEHGLGASLHVFGYRLAMIVSGGIALIWADQWQSWPRVYALMLALPMLTFIAMLSGIVGGMLVSALTLDISPVLFLSRIQDNVGLIHFWVGMAKAPIFAFLIAVIGCLEGFRVQGSAQSVGEHTTSAVVQSIFVVIVVDAIAALFCMEMGW